MPAAPHTGIMDIAAGGEVLVLPDIGLRLVNRTPQMIIAVEAVFRLPLTILDYPRDTATLLLGFISSWCSL